MPAPLFLERFTFAIVIFNLIEKKSVQMRMRLLECTNNWKPRCDDIPKLQMNASLAASSAKEKNKGWSLWAMNSLSEYKGHLSPSETVRRFRSECGPSLHRALLTGPRTEEVTISSNHKRSPEQHFLQCKASCLILIGPVRAGAIMPIWNRLRDRGSEGLNNSPKVKPQEAWPPYDCHFLYHCCISTSPSNYLYIGNW